MRVVAGKLINLGLLAAAIIFSLFVSDWILATLDFPEEPRLSISHPPYFEEIRDNLEFNHLFKTNGRGLRYADISMEKPPGVKRVFVSGDSYTEGVGIQDGSRFTDLLEKDLRFHDEKVRFINGGLSGTGPLEYGRLFLRVGLEYSPDALLVCVFVNDVANTPEELGDYYLGGPPPRRAGINRIAHAGWPHIYTLLKHLQLGWEYRRKTRTLDFVVDVSRVAKKRGVAESRIEEWRASLPSTLVAAANRGRFNAAILSHSLLYRLYWRESIDIGTDRARQKWENMARLLGELVKRTRGHGIEVGAVLIPSVFQYDRGSHHETNPWIVAGADVDRNWLREDTAIQERMRSWADAAGVPLLDLTPVFREASERGATLNWRLDGHWNTAGHELAAEAIASWLCAGQVFWFVESGGCGPSETEPGEAGR